jgi:germination protein M
VVPDVGPWHGSALGATVKSKLKGDVVRILRVGLVLGLLAVASACGNGDDTATSTVPPDATTLSSSTITSQAPGTTAPSTESGTTPTTESPDATAVSAPSPTTPSTNPTRVDVRIYLLRDERLAVTHRQVAGPAVLHSALAELLEGPTDSERTAGLHTEIPDGTTLRDLNLADGLATVDLSGDYERGGGTLSMTARLAQVIFTATQFDNVDEVLFWLDGAPVEFFGGEGIVLGDAQQRRDVDWALTKGIIIDTPLPGATVTSPITVTGEGDVFEADFPMEVRRNGERISDVVIVFAGAWGNWADFQTTISVDAPTGPIELVALSPVGCTPDSEPNCPVDLETVVPLTLTG